MMSFTALVLAMALGQANWVHPYEKGISEIRAENWTAAVGLLQDAIAIDPVPGANKRVEASIAEDYFPQYYLFYAFVKLKEYDKARPYASAARPPKPIVPDFQSALDDYEQVRRFAADKAAADRVAAERAAKAAVDRVAMERIAAERASAKAAAEKTIADRAATLAEFDALIAKGNQALAAKKWLDALTAYDAACAKLPDEFMRRGLQSRVDAVVRAMIASPARPRP